MKFIINLIAPAIVLILAMETCEAAPIQIFYEHDSLNAQEVKTIFTAKYHIPEDLIALRPVGKCDGLNVRGKLDVCLNNNGDLIVVSVDRGFISESLKIFQAP